LDAARLAAPAGMDLRLHGAGEAEPLGRGHYFVDRVARLPVERRHLVTAEQVLRLMLVNVHGSRRSNRKTPGGASVGAPSGPGATRPSLRHVLMAAGLWMSRAAHAIGRCLARETCGTSGSEGGCSGLGCARRGPGTSRR